MLVGVVTHVWRLPGMRAEAPEFDLGSMGDGPTESISPDIHFTRPMHVTIAVQLKLDVLDAVREVAVMLSRCNPDRINDLNGTIRELQFQKSGHIFNCCTGCS